MKYCFIQHVKLSILLEERRIGIIFMVLGAVMLAIPLIITITESSIRIFVPMISLLFLLFGFPIILNSKKGKNMENYALLHNLFFSTHLANQF